MIHIGTYDLTTGKAPDEICSEILKLIKEFKTDKNKIVVSNIVPRVDTHNTKLKKINTLLFLFFIIFHIIISMWRNP